MDKLLLFPGANERGIFTYVIDTEHTHLVKTAAEYHPTIASYISNAKKIPGKTQILLTALGAGEYWGCNVNGDYFPEASLAFEGDNYGYKTFQKNAKVYKHHINKDPTAAYGDVPLAVYNPRYHRVELIVLLDNSKAPDIVERIENGDYPEWSMGCKVPFDVCSICGNKAPTRKQYCDHLRYYMGRIDPATGRQAYAINLTPNFFDISQVLIGADKIAKTLKKVASVRHTPTMSSAYIAEKMAESKAAAIVKEVPASTPPGTQDMLDGIMEVKSRERSLPVAVLNRLGQAPLPRVLSTLAMLGILPKPQEFQRIVLISIGKSSIADQLDKHGMCFDPMMSPDPTPENIKMAGISASNFDPYLFETLKPYMSERSYYAPHLGARVSAMLEKNASAEPLPYFIKVADEERKPLGIIPMLTIAAGLYAAFAHKAAPEAAGSLDKLISSHPGLAAAIGIGIASTFGAMAGSKMRGQTAASENPDITDPFAKVQELRERPFLKVGKLLGPSAKQVLVGIPAAYMASGVLQKHHEANPQEQRGRVYNFIRKYPDIISGALALNSVADLHGKGAYSQYKAVKNLAKPFLDKVKSKVSSGFAKSATLSEFASNSLIWPVAFGKAGLPGRMVGGLFDQAVVEASRKLLSNKGNPNKLETHRRKE